MSEQYDHDRSKNRSWWADTLDPGENLRTLTDARGVGRRAAEELAARLLAWGGGHNGDRHDRSTTGTRPLNGDLNQVLRQLRADAMLAGDVAASVIDNASTLLSILLSRLPGSSEQQAGMKPLVLDPVAPGAEQTAVFWVHNTSAAAVAAVRPHCAPLRSHTGCELADTTVRFDPQVLDPLPPRSSCGIEVGVSIPPAAEPGTYVSVILASHVPELYLPLCVTVVLEQEPQ
ncbi:MAG: hypothetical protein ACRDRX_04060 [Pseudonocardiaceae bacterium]